jgi:hypothetical protein
MMVATAEVSRLGVDESAAITWLWSAAESNPT